MADEIQHPGPSGHDRDNGDYLFHRPVADGDLAGEAEEEEEKMKVRLYTYKVVKEDFHTGKRGKRKKSCQRPYPLKIGGLYAHLGTEFPGFWRVLELIKVEEVD